MPTPPPERSLSTASSSNYGSKIINDEDVKTIVEKFCLLFSRLEFDEAQKLIETHKMVTTTLIQSGDRIWQQILMNIAQLAAAEQSYFTLSFFSTKFSFTKNHNSSREHYNKIRQDLRRIDDNASSPFSHPEIANNKLRKDIVDYFSYYAATRLDMIDFYVGLPVRDWRSIVDESLTRLESVFDVYSKSTAYSFAPQPDLIYKELNLLLKSFQIKQKLSHVFMLDTLILMKDLRLSFANFLKDVNHAISSKQSNPGFFSFMKSSKNHQKYFLLNWLTALFNTILAKFSIYFNDVLGPYVPTNELKQFQMTNNPMNMHLYFSSFMRKQGVSVIAIVMCRENDEKQFYGFGYHRFLQKFPLDTIQPSKDKFPVLFSMINEKQKSYEIWKPKIDDFLSFSHQIVISEGKTKYLADKEKSTEMTFFCNHIEWQLFLVLCFERKVAEKESTVQNFLTDVVGFLRFSKLHQELRTPAKSGSS